MLNNSINNFSSFLTIDPGASGDSFVQFTETATPRFRMGVDDSDGNAFKLSIGSALGTSDTFVLDTSGRRTLPLQPAFLAYENASPVDVTGDGTVYTMVYDTEEFDRGGDFDGTSTFTAPVAGKYFLYTAISLVNVASGSGFTTVRPSIVCSTAGTFSRAFSTVAGASLTADIGTFVNLAAGETVTTTIAVSGGAKTVDIQGNTGAGVKVTYFFGYLAT
jgi:hypothetical protein